jgi:ABC-type glycerol-3-phosphate transport system permease component
MANVDLTQNKTQQAVGEAAVMVPRRRLPWGSIGTYTILILGAVVSLMPFLWMINWSFMSSFEVSAGYFVPSRFFPTEADYQAVGDGNIVTGFVLANYIEAWQRADFTRLIWNSVRITALRVGGLLIVCVPAAYAFARMRFFGRDFLFMLMLTTLMIPGVVTLIPNYLTVVWFSRLSESVFGEAGKWLDNWPSLTIPFLASAFTIFLLRQFFAQIPKDLWDAAQLDGAGHLGFMMRVVVPLSRAPIFTVAIFTFIGAWNALLWPLLVITTEDWRPIAQGLQYFVQTDADSEAHLQMAAAVITVLPIIVLYFFTQKQFTEGLWTGSIRG